MTSEASTPLKSKSGANHGPAILAVCLSSIIMASLCVFLRLYIRVRLTHSFWWDDGLIVASLVWENGFRPDVIMVDDDRTGSFTGRNSL